MFMKIFTVLIISLNNIFTIPQKINNNDKATEQLIRNKRESKETYELNLKKGFVYLVKNRWKKPNTDIKWDLYIHTHNNDQ